MKEQSKKSETQEYWKEWSKITRLFHANETRSLGFSESMLFASDYANEQNKKQSLKIDLLFDEIKAHKQQNKELKEENEFLKQSLNSEEGITEGLSKKVQQYEAENLVKKFLEQAKEIEQLKNRVNELEEFVKKTTNLATYNSFKGRDEALELLNNKNKEG